MHHTNSEVVGPPRCPLCSTAGSSPLCQVDGFAVWRCVTCCADFVFPPPDSLTLKTLYDRERWFEGGEKGGYQNYDQQTSPLLQPFEELLARLEPGSGERSVLDIGCGYGSHLAIASRRGWKCFGVEVSEHARRILEQRYGGQIFVAESVQRLIPHKFDLVLMLDALEHMVDPWQLFFDLFSRGAIVPETRVLVTTPNARSYEALRDPAGWAYRHPPSHLFFYSAESLARLFQRLRFAEIEVSGIHPTANAPCPGYSDEGSERNQALAGFAGVRVVASGSDFAEFMHERYVPGTWSKLAEYEHLPRYLLAQRMAAGARVLDFACGTGYGSALLAKTAVSVLGVDLDAAALEWAQREHIRPNLRFERRDDLGEGLPAASFELITCFEMIEHVDGVTQAKAIRSFARLLKPEGQLIISTPNPEVTANYGENPYHLKELSRTEFTELVSKHFAHVEIFEQRIAPSVTIRSQVSDGVGDSLAEPGADIAPAAAYVAVCSQRAMPRLPGFLYFDTDCDLVKTVTENDRDLNVTRLAHLQASERLMALRKVNQAYEEQIREREGEVQDITARLHLRNLTLQQREAEIQHRDAEIAFLKSSRWLQLGETLREPVSFRKLGRLTFLLGAVLTPQWLRIKLHPVTERLRSVRGRSNKPSTRRHWALSPAPQRLERESIEMVSVVIPTKNAGDLFSAVLEGIRAQKLGANLELVVIDSGSSDATVSVARKFGAHVIEIEPSSFDHGGTRNLGIESTRGDIVVLTTQDAIPGDEGLLSHLIEPFSDPYVAGAYARQVPRPDADAVTRRRLNDWITGGTAPHVKSIASSEAYDLLTPIERYRFCNFDNVCSAIRKSVWQKIPLPGSEFGEDVSWAKAVLEAGYKIAYQPSAWVVHSHPRRLHREFKRTLMCHKKLYELFELRTVPSPRHFVTSTVRCCLADWQCALKEEKAVSRRLKLLLDIPVFDVALVYAQYAGAREAKKKITSQTPAPNP